MSEWVVELPLDLEKPHLAGTTSGGIYYRAIDVQTNQATREFYRRVAYELTTPEGVDDNSSLSITYIPGDRDFTLNRLKIHRGGKTIDRVEGQEIRVLQRESSIERNLYDDRSSAHLLLEDVRVGDVLDYASAIVTNVTSKLMVLAFRWHPQPLELPRELARDQAVGLGGAG